jgi:hypothetical protein
MANRPEQTYPLKAGTKLRYPLYGESGVMLLAAGAEITPQLRALLDRRGIRIEMQASLRVVKGVPLDLEIPVKDGLEIGRNAECQVRPDCRFVSTRHCRLHLKPFGLFIEDLHSTNGTFVNGYRIPVEQELSDGDTVQIGTMAFLTHVYAAVAADSAEDKEALDAWILAEPSRDGKVNEPDLGRTQRIYEDPDPGVPPA